MLDLADSEKCEHYESCRVNTYRGLIADKQLYWISSALYEGGGDSVISRKSGQSVYVTSKPYVSPDNRFVVSASEDLAFELAGVWLWEVKDGELVSKYKFETEEHQLFRFVRWIDSRKIELIKITIAPEGMCPENKLLTEAEYTVELSEKNGDWVLESISDVGKCFSRF